MGSVLEKLNVQVGGNSTAETTMLLVHGFGTDQTSWDKIAPAFQPDHRIVRLDNMGAGRSDNSAFSQYEYLHLERYARDVVDVCAALNLCDAIFVGHSVGAMMGVLAALEAPRHFSKMVLIGASPRYRDDEGYRGVFTDAEVEHLYQTVTLHYSQWAESYAALAMANSDRPHLAEEFAESLKSLELDHALTTLYAILQSDHRAELPRLRKPTLLIQARDDVAVPLEVAHYLHRQIVGSRLALIDASGHFPHISAPDQVVAAMRDFLGAP